MLLKAFFYNYNQFISMIVFFIFFLILITIISFKANWSFSSNDFPSGVCPPFYLLDEDGNIINPIIGKNANKPYSPKMTCGKCHNYEEITKGYHFTQGKGEKPTPTQAERCLWAITPGNYGGT